MGRAVQFRGSENALDAFENMKVEAWSLWNEKQLLVKGIGSEMLKAFLDKLAESESRALYTLKVYEDIDDAKEIKDKTPADGSFNFTLFDIKNDQYEGGQYYDSNKKNRLFQRLDAIEEKINGVGEVEEKRTIGSVLLDLLEQPQELQTLVNVVKGLPEVVVSLLTGISNMGNSPVQQPAQLMPLPVIQNQNFENMNARIGNTQPQTKGITHLTDEQIVERTGQALETLQLHDPELLTHLEKLAELAKKNPKKFKGLLTMLDIF